MKSASPDEQRGGEVVQRGDDRDQEPADGEADQRHEVEDRHQDAERDREVDAEQLEREPGEDAGEDREEEVDA